MRQAGEQLAVYPESVVEHGGTRYWLARDPETGEKWLCVQGDAAGFVGSRQGEMLYGPLCADNAAALRQRLPWLNPVALGVRTSAGFGDRQGLATPGHVRAVRGSGIAPIFAQQSVRENARIGRTPQDVLDAATWGVFQAGWREPWGADADHVKTPDAIAPFAAAGYSFLTIDPSDHIDLHAESDRPAALAARLAALPWAELDTSLEDLKARYLNTTFDLDNQVLALDEETLLRSAVKFGRAVAHIALMHRALTAQVGGRPFDFEVSVDETEAPTTTAEHVFLAGEMRRLGVAWVSLAPRFVGRFEKGVDYIGDLAALDRCLAGHVAVMRYFGGYKLSLHSGSDKFSVYPLAARHTCGRVHLKTAGTSLLEAQRVCAEVEPAVFRDMLDFACSRFDADRASYHISADLRNVPPAGVLPDDALPALLDQFDVRQVLHVTFGSIMVQFGAQLREILSCHEHRYFTLLERHFARHLAPFAVPTELHEGE